MAITQQQITEIRALIPDDAAIFGTAGNEHMFSDEQITAIFEGSGKGSVARTVGWACMALGGSDLTIAKNIRNDEITTAGNLTAAEWRLRAREYWGYAGAEDGPEEYFDLIDPAPFRQHAEASPWDRGSWL